MTNRSRIAVVTALALVTAAGAANAQIGSPHTWNVCGGNTFNTCASVDVSISALNRVTIRIWNLSGFFGSPAGTFFTFLGIDNVGNVAVAPVPNVVMTAGSAGTVGSPAAWNVKSNLKPKGGANIVIDLLAADNSGSTGGQHPTTFQTGTPANSIRNTCAPVMTGTNPVWLNPCSVPGSTADPGYVSLSFNITGTWDLTNATLYIKGQSATNSTECITGAGGNCNNIVTPEPITMLLLGSGLAGMGGVSVFRRRKRDDEV